MSSNLSKQRYCRYDGTSMQPESPKNRRRGESCRLEHTHAPDARQRPGGMITSSVMHGRSGVGGGCAGLQQFWCVEKPVKFLENPGRNRAQLLNPFFQTKKHMKTVVLLFFVFFKAHKMLFMIFVRKNLSHKNFSGQFRKVRAKTFCTPKNLPSRSPTLVCDLMWS